MNFENEIVKSGKLDKFGQPVTGNVDQTIHSGVELSFQYNIKNIFKFYLNSTYSQNKISNGYYFIDSENKINLSGNKISGFLIFWRMPALTTVLMGLILTYHSGT